MKTQLPALLHSLCCRIIAEFVSCWPGGRTHTSPRPARKGSVRNNTLKKNKNANEQNEICMLLWRTVPLPPLPVIKVTLSWELITEMVNLTHVPSFDFSLACQSECPELSIIHRYRKRPQLPVLITASVLGAHLCNLESAAHHAERKVSIMVPRPLIIEF